MPSSLEEALAQLGRDYLAEAPARLAELRKDLAALEAGESDALDSLRARFHRLAGSGGSHGFNEVSEVSRRAELWIQAHPAAADAYEVLRREIDALTQAFDRAGAAVGPAAGPAAALRRHVEFTWNALVVGASPDRAAALTGLLESAGFAVRVAEPSGTAPDAVPTHAHPDLVVVVHEVNGPDPYIIAAAWTSRGRFRPRAVVLFEVAGPVDRLRAASAGIDAIFRGVNADTELPAYARALARVGQPPGSVVLVEDDATTARLIISVLEQANLRVTWCRGIRDAERLVEGSYPDLFLLDVRLQDGDGFTLARYIRQDPRFALTPVVFLTAVTGPESQVEALRAGGDDYLPKPADPALLTQLTVSRIERARRVRELAHRDGLTGLLNHATLMAELTHAVDAGNRRSEPFAFVMIDLDHFKRVNDKHGHLAGDRLLVHVANVLQRIGRASDLLGRYGGDEFGVLLPQNNAEGALAFAERARAALAEDPPVSPDGERLVVRLSVGVAVFPEDGTRASALVQAADRALYQAKRRGRDQVVRASDVN
ncbi:MAG TPA: diguanylate cyclase [Gemmatimonadales bacterium]|jgi:diguanylate cyclase (GGDEF)-like protein|nr:diguanylate cyclase [Gemmatimonadales bacterium]